jgi:hypothetical protein
MKFKDKSWRHEHFSIATKFIVDSSIQKGGAMNN